MLGKKELKELSNATEEALRNIFRSALDDAESALGKVKTITDLEKKIASLEVEKDKREWEYERKEEEIDHRVGLERKRQEQEIELAKRDAILTVKEENMNADRTRFEKEMTFIRERFEKEVGYLKDIVTEVLDVVKGGGGKDGG